MEMHLNVFDPKRRPVDVEGLMKWARIGVPARTFAGLCTSSTEVVSANVLATHQEFMNAGDKMEYLIWTGNLGVEDEAAAHADAHAQWMPYLVGLFLKSGPQDETPLTEIYTSNLVSRRQSRRGDRIVAGGMHKPSRGEAVSWRGYYWRLWPSMAMPTVDAFMQQESAYGRRFGLTSRHEQYGDASCTATAPPVPPHLLRAYMGGNMQSVASTTWARGPCMYTRHEDVMRVAENLHEHVKKALEHDVLVPRVFAPQKWDDDDEDLCTQVTVLMAMHAETQQTGRVFSVREMQERVGARKLAPLSWVLRERLSRLQVYLEECKKKWLAVTIDAVVPP